MPTGELKQPFSYKPHPFSEIPPLQEGPPLWKLADDIKENGQHHPIDLFEDDGELWILDGRRRELACFRAKVEPKYKIFKGTRIAALKYARSMSLRRDLGVADREAVEKRYALTLADLLREGAGRPAASDTELTLAQAAAQADTTVDEMRKTKKVAQAAPEVRQAYIDGKLTVSDAAALAGETPAKQKRAVAAVVAGKARSGMGAVRPKDKPKGGRMVYDDRIINDFIGKLVRALAARANAIGKSKEHEACITAMDKVANAWEAWQKKTV